MRLALHFSGPHAASRARHIRGLLARTDPGEHAVRARLRTLQTAASVFHDPAEASRLAVEAAAEAQRAGDEVSQSWALLARSIADVSPAGVPQRRVDTAEILRVAAKTGETEYVPIAFFLHLSALAELGMISELDHALSPSGTLLSTFENLRHDRHVAWFRCLRATLDGDAERAEQIAHDGLQVALAADDPDAHSVWVGQLSIIRWMQGRVVELEPAFLQARQTAPHEPVWAASLAWIWLRQGRRSAARSLLSSLPGFDGLPADRNWLSTACILAVVAAELGETHLAAAAGRALLPFEDRLVTIGLGVTCWGTVSRPLALVAQAHGDTEGAIRHYRRAIEVTARVGAHPWLAEAQIELAALLASHGDADRGREAIELAEEAAATGRALDLHGVEAAASRLRETLRPARADATDATPEQPRPIVRVLGAFEVISADGVTARWQSRKARELLKILIARRGVEISRDTLMHLMWPDRAPQEVANRFSVAASTVRRALDPHRLAAPDAYLHTAGPTVRLCTERLDIDLERFLAESAPVLASSPLRDEDIARLRETLELHRGDALADEPEAVWAEQIRGEVHVAFFAVAHALADAARERGDHLLLADCCRRILAIDAYDQRAHEGLVRALTAQGAHGQAAAARETYLQRMAELGIPLP